MFPDPGTARGSLVSTSDPDLAVSDPISVILTSHFVGSCAHNHDVC